jgi:hypothetical protein
MNEVRVRNSDRCQYTEWTSDGTKRVCGGKMIAHSGEEFVDLEHNRFFKVVSRCVECQREYVLMRKDNRRTNGQ